MKSWADSDAPIEIKARKQIDDHCDLLNNHANQSSEKSLRIIFESDCNNHLHKFAIWSLDYDSSVQFSLKLVTTSVIKNNRMESVKFEASCYDERSIYSDRFFVSYSLILNKLQHYMKHHIFIFRKIIFS